MEEEGVIERYVEVLKKEKIGKGLKFLKRIRIDKKDEEKIKKLENEIMRMKKVMEWYLMMGDYDEMIRGVEKDIEDYRSLK